MKWNSFQAYFHLSWYAWMQEFIEGGACDGIYKFLKGRNKVATVTPGSGDVWRAFSLCRKDNLKIVLIGQDPYPQKGVANGLAFSHNEWPLQPSLEIIFNAIEEDCYDGFNLRMDVSPKLDEWAEMGILLLNYSLTTEFGNPGAHRDLWIPFHEFLIKKVNQELDNVVFILLGSKAQDLRRFVDEEKHLVLEAEHPARADKEGRKMYHNKVFSKANEYLKETRNEEVDWARTLPF